MVKTRISELRPHRSGKSRIMELVTEHLLNEVKTVMIVRSHYIEILGASVAKDITSVEESLRLPDKPK